MTLDDRLRAGVAQADPETPDVAGELMRVEQRATRRRRQRVVTAVVAVAAIGAALVGVVALGRGSERRTEIGSVPTTEAGSGVLAPSELPTGMSLIGVMPPSGGYGSGGSGSPFAFTRTYAQFSADGTQVDRSFQLSVGSGDENTEAYRANPGDTIDINGLPAKISGDTQHSTLIWFDGDGGMFQLIGDMPPGDAIDVAAGLTIDPDAGSAPRSAELDQVPDGFVHLFDATNPRITTFRGRTILYYATPTRDATLEVEVQQHPSDTVEELLLLEDSRVVDVRGQRGVYADGLITGGRTLRWTEPGLGLVTLTASTLTEDQLHTVAEALRPVSRREWKRLRDEVGTIGSSPPTTDPAEATVPPLPAIGPEIVAAQGAIDGESWTLVVYEAEPASGQPERRFCYELRGNQPSQPSCFPLRDDGTPGSKWLYGERRFGQWFLLGAAPHGAPSELAPADGQPVPLQISEDPNLPFQVFAAVLPDPYNGTFSIRDQGGQGVTVGGPAPEGTRLPYSRPGLPGVYPEFPSPAFRAGGITPPPANVPTTPTTSKAAPTATVDRDAVVQVLNGSGTAGIATMRTSQLSGLGWNMVRAGNAAAPALGNVIQCTDTTAARHLRTTLRHLGVSATIEPIPNPAPETHDPNANCYIILGE